MLLAFFLFIGKWISSFYFFDEDLGLRIILESHSDGYFYFPYVKALSTLNFNNSFELNVNDLKNISLPLGSIYPGVFLYFCIFNNILFNIFKIWVISNIFNNIFFIIIYFTKPISLAWFRCNTLHIKSKWFLWFEISKVNSCKFIFILFYFFFI